MLVEVRTATASEEEARSIASALVESGLCAFAHIDAVESYYRWQGQVEHEDEFRVTAACRNEVVERVSEAIRTLHSYEEPAIYIFQINGGSESYLRWIRENSNSLAEG